MLHSAADAAILNVADANQFSGPGYRQGFQQDGVHERKDGRRRTDAQCKRQHGLSRETGSMNKLPHRITDIVYEMHSPSGDLDAGILIHVLVNKRESLPA